LVDGDNEVLRRFGRRRVSPATDIALEQVLK
jgi:hypothetical protein